jgi:hypothetical protein
MRLAIGERRKKSLERDAVEKVETKTEDLQSLRSVFSDGK